MRVIITGARDWYCYELATKVLTGLIAKHGANDLVIVHGAAPGVDSAFAQACHDNIIEDEPHPAHWKAFGNGAGPKRNQEMVDSGADLCLAFHPHLSISKGTRDCVRRALKAGIPTWWTWCHDDPPVRQRLPKIVDTEESPLFTEDT